MFREPAFCLFSETVGDETGKMNDIRFHMIRTKEVYLSVLSIARTRVVPFPQVDDLQVNHSLTLLLSFSAFSVSFAGRDRLRTSN